MEDDNDQSIDKKTVVISTYRIGCILCSIFGIILGRGLNNLIG